MARFDEERFVLAGNSPRDLAWLRAHAVGDVEIEPVTDARAYLALWGPLAREILAPIADAELSNDAFPYRAARTIRIAGIAVDAVRISYAGELGWELSCAANDGERSGTRCGRRERPTVWSRRVVPRSGPSASRRGIARGAPT